jgi:hypothetical protein
MADVAKHVPPPPVPQAGAAKNELIPAQLPQFHVPDIVEDRRIDSAGNTIVRKYVRGKLLGKVRLLGRQTVGQRSILQ